MKKALLLLLLAAGCVPMGPRALGAGLTSMPGSLIIWQESQVSSVSAPTLATQGFPLGYVSSIHALVKCNDGSNITAGTETAFYFSPTLVTWAPAPTYDNFTVATGGPIAVGPEFTVTNPFGRFYWASTGITCSGSNGTTITVEQDHLP